MNYATDILLTPEKLAHEISSDIMASEAEIADALRAMILAARKAERAACASLVNVDDEENCIDYQWGEDRNSYVAQETLKQVHAAIAARAKND